MDIGAGLRNGATDKIKTRGTRIPAPALLLLLLSVCSVGMLGASDRAEAAGTYRFFGRGQQASTSPWDIQAREYLGTPQSEAAVNRGLAYLATHQSADGHWRSGTYETEVGITGLCLMSFLAAGHQPGRGRYGAVMNQAIDFLVNSVDMSGAYTDPGLIRSGSAGQPMYGHGFAILALCEAYGMTHRRDLKRKLQAAIHLIEDTQTQNSNYNYDGGWRYNAVQGDADISVTGVQLMALRAARNAGLKVAQSTIDHAIAYIKRCVNRVSGGFNYQVNQRIPAQPRTGEAVLSLFMAGMRNSPECQSGLQFLLKYPIDRNNSWPHIEHFYYGLYYVTQAMYQAGGSYWQHWYPTVRDHLVSNQDPDGSWSRTDGYSEAGTEYATAMSVLVLQVPAGLLPIYQK